MVAPPYKRSSDGRWCAVLDEGWQDGKRRRRVFYGKTKREAEQKRQDAIRRGIRASRTSHTVETWLREWMTDVHGHALKPSTQRSHQSKIDRYLIPLLGKHRLDALEPQHVRRAYRRLSMPCPDGDCAHSPSHGLADATVRQTHAILKRALADAVKERLIFENVTDHVDAPATGNNPRDRLTTAQADLALKIADETDPELASMFYVALRMGTRPGEHLGLPWGLVDLNAATITIARTLEHGAGVRYGTPKSRASNRTIAIEPTCLARLRVHFARYVEQHGGPPPADAPVWTQPDGRPVTHTVWAKRWRTLMDRAGLPRVTPYSARASAAARLEELGWPPRLVAEYLGHTNVKTTYIYQQNAGVERQAAAFRQLGPPNVLDS